MTRKRRRLLALVAGLAFLGGAAFLALSALKDTIVFFYSPSELAQAAVGQGRPVRIGGLVEQGSVVHAVDGSITFRVTDLKRSIAVAYAGALPDLFREGQGVVAEGSVGADGVFRATQVLAKHDENYMPPEVAKALKKSGRWQEGQQGAVPQ